jgi:hypothetical protein
MILGIVRSVLLRWRFRSSPCELPRNFSMLGCNLAERQAYRCIAFADKDFNLISDVGLNVNAHFIGQDGTETGFDGTWMSALGFTWSEGNTVRTATITVKQVRFFTPSQRLQSSAQKVSFSFKACLL